MVDNGLGITLLPTLAVNAGLLSGTNLSLYISHGSMATLPIVMVEHFLIRVAMYDCGKLLCQIQRIVNAAIHAHTANRIVHMGTIVINLRTLTPPI